MAQTSGLGLYQSCQLTTKPENSLSENDHLRYVTCVVFVTAITMGYEMGTKTRCVAAGTTNTQLGIIVYKYLDDHPEMLNLDPGTLTIRAVRQAFPCPVKH
ncbi:hypothetical protein AciX9_4679 (plasmid) [Granulicella tundricola MP5ACTX9]|uniref:Rap1a immunity protein domain-containing protein n=2 Tax=Granulicella TaxID=940557 RepID=E8X824_GRATM|nr:hypothetical protein AciX9_4679 [Granulicella tundricola MP5ACTX9]